MNMYQDTLQKLEILFSKNTHEDDKDAIKNILQM